MTALYTSGTISLVNGSAVITGIDTAWKTALIVGGTVHVEAEGNPLPILADDSAGASEHPITDTQMTAAIKWQGASGTYKYALVRENTYTTAQAENSTKIAELLRRLNHPTIAAIAAVQAEQDHLILLTGQSTATIIPRSSLIQGIKTNGAAETPEGLATYESEAAGFIVLVADAGDERAALYFKLSATAGDWSDPAFLTGEKGIKGDTGATGITWRGAWNNVAAYAKNDVVQNNKSAWIALRGNTGVAPPGLPTTANADWELFARAGVDGGDRRCRWARRWGRRKADCRFQNRNWKRHRGSDPCGSPFLCSGSNQQLSQQDHEPFRGAKYPWCRQSSNPCRWSVRA